MTKYICECGNEVNRLVVCYQYSASGGYPSKSVYVCCKEKAGQIMQIVNLDSGSVLSIPISITVSTKRMAVNQIIAQYIKSDRATVFVSKSEIKKALVDVKKNNEN